TTEIYTLSLHDALPICLPHWHLLAHVALDLLGHLLEEGAGGAPATGACRDLRGEAADADGLQNLLRDCDLFSAVAIGHWRERHANGIAEAFLHQHGQRGCAAYNAFGSHAGFGE